MGGVRFASVARICREWLKEKKERGNSFDGVDSEVSCFHEEGEWEEELGLDIFVICSCGGS